MSRLYESMMFERQEKEDALLELPSAVESNTKLIGCLEEQIFRTEARIEELHLAHKHAEKWQSRMREYVLGGIVGALIGMVFSRLLM